VSDVAEWLNSIGLAQYAHLFAEHDIDASVLFDLTDQDLEKIGLSLGHRRRFLRAIAAKKQVRSFAQGAERRQLTVMFCDLVGSTALSARLDPEDMHVLIRTFQQTCARLIATYDGFVAQFQGDGILAYFGYPRAHEDDAERAVRAGLDMVAALASLEPLSGVQLEARIGIATGLVLVGERFKDIAQEPSVVGDPPNLAARLQAVAAPGTVVVAASTRRLVGRIFDLRALGGQKLKGFDEPIEAWAVTRAATVESRFEAARPVDLTEFVGREGELGSLLEYLGTAWAGHGKVVLISGEAGIGKSRLTALLAERIGAKPHTRLRYQCSPYHRDSALFPFIEHLTNAAQLTVDDSPERALDKIEAVLRRGNERIEAAVPLIASLLSISTGARYPPIILSSGQRRRQTFTALVDQLEGLARQNPVLVVFEDAQWADATSLELLDLAFERIRLLPVLAVVTHRPDFEVPWEGRPNVAALSLGRLDPPAVRAMIERVTGGKRLPDEIVAQIVEKTDGIPLFVEELTKMVLELGLLVLDGKGYRLTGPLPQLAIPATLQDSLTARLDRLGPVKEIAQVGAALGREFPCELLVEVAGRDRGSLDAGLTALEAANLISRRGEGPSAVYVFKHALIQDAAYEGLLKSRRVGLHRRIAEVLVARFSSLVKAQPELVAHHFTQAGSVDLASEWWSKAGDLALVRAAFIEAAGHFARAIVAAERIPDAADAWRLQLRLQIAYGQALISARGYGAPETTAAFAKARALAGGITDASARFSAYYGLWVGSYVRGELQPMRDVTGVFLRETRNRRGIAESGIAHRVAGLTHLFEGNLLAAQPYFEHACVAFDAEPDRGLASLFGHDIGVAAYILLALVLWPLGDVERARRLADAGMARALQLRHVPTLAYAHSWKFVFEATRRDPVRARDHAEVLLELSREHQMRMWLSFATFDAGWAHFCAGDRAEGMDGMRRGMALLVEQGVHATLPLLGVRFAEAQAADGDVDCALSTVDELLASTRRTGQAWYDAELHRQRAEILLLRRPGDRGEAEAAFASAHGIAQAQQARPFALWAALGQARLLEERGRVGEACELLSSALAGLKDGGEILEFGAAVELLQRLGGSAGL
jgi:class 3 adenylate cyclase/predicted ATPase